MSLWILIHVLHIEVLTLPQRLVPVLLLHTPVLLQSVSRPTSRPKSAYKNRATHVQTGRPAKKPGDRLANW